MTASEKNARYTQISAQPNSNTTYHSINRKKCYINAEEYLHGLGQKAVIDSDLRSSLAVCFTFLYSYSTASSSCWFSGQDTDSSQVQFCHWMYGTGSFKHQMQCKS